MSTPIGQDKYNIIPHKDEETVEMTQNRDEDALLKSLIDKIDAHRKKGKAGAAAE